MSPPSRCWSSWPEVVCCDQIPCQCGDKGLDHPLYALLTEPLCLSGVFPFELLQLPFEGPSTGLELFVEGLQFVVAVDPVGRPSALWTASPDPRVTRKIDFSAI